MYRLQNYPAIITIFKSELKDSVLYENTFDFDRFNAYLTIYNVGWLTYALSAKKECDNFDFIFCLFSALFVVSWLCEINLVCASCLHYVSNCYCSAFVFFIKVEFQFNSSLLCFYKY